MESDLHGAVESSTMFVEFDNLDTKTITEAQNNYERTFITIRNAMEQNEQFCCDDETDRLSLTQLIVDLLRDNQLINREQK